MGSGTKFRLAARFGRRAQDYERLDTTLKGLHYMAFTSIMPTRISHVLAQKL